MQTTTKFHIRYVVLTFFLAMPFTARADFASDIKEPVRLLEAKQFDKAAVALNKIAPLYQDQFALHYMIGLANLARLSDKAKPADSIKLLRSARASLRTARDLAPGEEQKKEIREMLAAAEEGLRFLNVPFDAPPADTPADKNKNAEIEGLKRRLAELQANPDKTKTTVPKQPAVEQPGAEFAVGPPDLPSTLPKLTPLKPTPKTAKGRVVNRAGKPLPGVVVTISGLAMVGHTTRFSPKTNAQGVFSTPLPDGLYTTSAEVKATYNDQSYTFELHPLDGEHDVPQDSRKGIVEDYVWRLSGLKPGQAEDGEDIRKYYGSSIIARFADMGSLYANRQGLAAHELAEFPRGFRIKLTFTPVGSMPDGLPGRAFSFSQSYKPDGTIMPYFGAGFDLVDVPVGRYTVRGRLVKPDGTERSLMLNTGVLPYPAPAPALSRTLDFEVSKLADIISPGSIFLYAWPVENHS